MENKTRKYTKGAIKVLAIALLGVLLGAGGLVACVAELERQDRYETRLGPN